MHRRGYWILPKGEIIDLGYKRHIQVVCEQPEAFGIDIAYIKSVYEKFGEIIPSEEKARNEIMFSLIERGFIRIREERNQWKIQVWVLNRTTENNILKWKETLGETIDKYADLIVDQLGKSRTSLDRVE